MKKRGAYALICAALLLSFLLAPASAAAPPTETGVSDWLETEAHIGYLKGFVEGTFQPERKITRAETARLFYRLLKDKDVEPVVRFFDVPDGTWFAPAVNTFVALGAIRGGGHRMFYPDRPITRAEFAAFAARFAKRPLILKEKFSDVEPDDWYYDAVCTVTAYGWMHGCKDGTFRPDGPVSRVEVAIFVNRMLGRSPDSAWIDAHRDELRPFSDVDPETYWAYYNVCEATNTHRYYRSGGKEHWTGLQ